jgi:hypothetical protein
MATIALGNLSYVGNTNGVATQVLTTAKEANSQTFKKGQFVTFDGAGAIKALDAGAFVTAGTDDSIDISDHVSVTAATTEEKILGLALKDATNVTSGNIVIPVQLLRAGDILEGNLVTGVDGTSLGTIALAANQLGDPVSCVQADTTDAYHFSTTVAEEFGRILRIPDGAGRGVIGDLNARVHVTVRGDIWFLG